MKAEKFVKKTSLDERLDLLMEVIRLRKEGKDDESLQFYMDNVPLDQNLADSVAVAFGKDFLVNAGFNLTEVDLSSIENRS